MTLQKRDFGVIGIALVCFIALHFLGVGLPLHQDEYKWVQYSHPEITPPGTVPHPPLTEFIYTKIAPVFTDDGFRFIPFIFGMINFFLLYYLVNLLFNKRTAQISIFIFTFSFYSLLASLMVDVDGAVMPFFFLILLIGYYKWKGQDFKFTDSTYKWLALILIGAICGFLIKISFLLAITAVFTDFLFVKKIFSNWRQVLRYSAYGLGGLGLLLIVLLLSKFIFPFFNLSNAFKYWEHFIVWDRGWMQTFIQCIKAVMYSSPFLILTPFLLEKIDWLKTRLFGFFLIFSFIFYIVLFDFSIGALDRYLQLLIVPLVVFSSVAISKIFNDESTRLKEFFFLGIIVSLLVLLLASVNHFVPPLYPKTEWIHRMLSLKWNFLYPFSGGSGPLGFYVSFLFISVSWVVSFFVVLFAIIKPQYKNRILLFLIPMALVYNGMFIEEYLFGFYNGSASKLVEQATEFIKNNPEIKMVTVYNDNGGNEIQQIGKYRKRLYIDPKFDINEKIMSLNKFKEHYLVVDIPHIDSGTIYQKYFNSCFIIYERTDRKILSRVYDCTGAPDLKI